MGPGCSDSIHAEYFKVVVRHDIFVFPAPYYQTFDGVRTSCDTRVMACEKQYSVVAMAHTLSSLREYMSTNFTYMVRTRYKWINNNRPFSPPSSDR